MMPATPGTVVGLVQRSGRQRAARSLVLVAAVVAGLAAGTQPMFAVVAGGMALLGVVVAIRPELATMLAVVLLYSNAAVIAHRVHGLPKLVGHASALLLLLALVHILLIKREKMLLPSALPWVVGYFLVQVVGATFSGDPATAFGEVQDFFLSGLLLFLAFSNAIRTEGALKRCVWLLLITGALIGAISLHQSSTGSYDNDYLGFAQINEGTAARLQMETEEEHTPRLAGPIGDKNYYAQIMVALIPLGLFLALGSKRSGSRVFAFGLTAMIAIGATLTFSRGGAIAILLTLLLMVLNGRLKIRHLLLVVMGIAVLLSFFPRYTERLESLTLAHNALSSTGSTDEVDGAVMGRLGEMAAALQIYAEHPMTGVGPGMYSTHYREYAIETGYAVHEGERAAHTMIPEVAAETGTIGLLCFLGAIGVTVRDLTRAGRRVRRTRPDLAIIIGGCQFAIVAYMASGIFLSLAFARYFWFLLALGAAASAIAMRTGGAIYETSTAEPPRTAPSLSNA